MAFLLIQKFGDPDGKCVFRVPKCSPWWRDLGQVDLAIEGCSGMEMTRHFGKMDGWEMYL